MGVFSGGGGPPLAKASYYDNSGIGISNAGLTIHYGTQHFDTTSSYDTSTGTYTVPTTAKYMIVYEIVTSNTAWTQGNVLQINIAQNGSENFNIGATDSAPASATYYRHLITSGILTCVAGDTIVFNCYCDISTTLSTFGFNGFSITQLA